MKIVNREIEKKKAVKQLLQLLQNSVYLSGTSQISSKKCESFRDVGLNALTEYKDEFHQLRGAFLKSNLLGSKESIDLVLRKYYSENVFISDRYIHFLFEVENSDLAIEAILNETSFLPSKSTIWNDFNKLKLSEHLSSSHLDERLDAYSIFLGFSGFRDAKRFDFRLDKKQEHEAKESIEDEIVVFFKENTQRNSKRLKKPPFTYIPPSITVSGFGLIRMFNRLKWYLGIRNWCYDWGENPPLGFTKTVVKAITSEYISSDFQSDTFVYEDADNREKDVLKRMYGELFGKPQGGYESCAYHFLFASSGIGKTSLVLRILVELKRRQYSDRKVYAIPFSNWRELSAMNQVEKEGAVIFLEAMDEDFSLSSPKHIESIINEFREATIGFDHIVITTRGEFFQRNEVLEKFTKATSEYPNYRYTMTVLCPFSDQQIQTFLNRNFRSRADKEKALRVINVIGRENINRQFLISKIRYLFTFLDSNKIIDDCKEYMLFDYMLKNWLRHERSTFNKILRQSDDERKTALENTYEFSKALSYLIYTRETDLANGFTFEEIISQLSNEFDQTEILINRTFLIRDANDRYRFTHQSVFEFFLSESIADLIGSSKDSLRTENISKIPFLRQTRYFRVYQIIKGIPFENLSIEIQVTTQLIEVEEYQSQIRFEPFFNGIEKRSSFYLNNWDSIDCVLTSPSLVYEILGIKFSVKDSELITNNLIRGEERRKCLRMLSQALPYFPSLICIDLSCMNLDDTYLLKLRNQNLEYLNLRDNNFESVSSIVNHSFTEVNLRQNTRLNLGKLHLSVSSLTIDFSEDLFSLLRSERIKGLKELYIYVDPIRLEAESFPDLGRIIIYSKISGVRIKVFTPLAVINTILFTFKSRFEIFDTVTDIDVFLTNPYYKRWRFGDEINDICLDRKGLKDYSIFAHLQNGVPDLGELSDLKLNLPRDLSQFNVDQLITIFSKLKNRVNILCVRGEGEYSILEEVVRKSESEHFLQFVCIYYKDKERKSWDSSYVLNETKGISNIKSLEGIKHLLIQNYPNDFILDSSLIENLESLFISTMALNSEFSSSALRRGLNLKRFAITVGGEVLIDFEHFVGFRSLESIVIRSSHLGYLKFDPEIIPSADGYKVSLELRNISYLGQFTALNSLVLVLPRTKNLEGIGYIKKIQSLERLVVSDWLYDSLMKLTQFPELIHFRLIPWKNAKNSYSLTSFKNILECDKIEVLEFWSLLSDLSGIEELKRLHLKELIFRIHFPSNEADFKKLKTSLGALLELDVERIECVFVLTKLNDFFNSNRVSYLIDELCEFKCEFIVSFYYCRLDSELDRSLFARFSVSNLFQNEEFNLLPANKISKELDWYQEEFCFKELFDAINFINPEAKFAVKGVTIDKRILESEILALYKEEYKQYNFEGIGYDNFLNSDFDFEISSEGIMRLFRALPVTWIRFINLNCNFNDGSLFRNMHSLRRISLSSLEGLSHDKVFSKMANLSEIEILFHYMPEKERGEIDFKVQDLEKNGFKVTFNYHPVIIQEHKRNILLETFVSST